MSMMVNSSRFAAAGPAYVTAALLTASMNLSALGAQIGDKLIIVAPYSTISHSGNSSTLTQTETITYEYTGYVYAMTLTDLSTITWALGASGGMYYLVRNATTITSRATFINNGANSFAVTIAASEKLMVGFVSNQFGVNWATTNWTKLAYDSSVFHKIVGHDLTPTPGSSKSYSISTAIGSTYSFAIFFGIA